MSTDQRIQELAGILSDVLDLTAQLKSGEVVSAEWIAARDMRISEARIALAPIMEEKREHDAATADTTTPTAVC